MKRRMVWVLAVCMIMVNVMSFGTSHGIVSSAAELETGADAEPKETEFEESSVSETETSLETKAAEVGLEAESGETAEDGAVTEDESGTQPESGTASDGATELPSESGTETEPGTETEAETETETETEAETETETEIETETETETETESETEQLKRSVFTGMRSRLANSMEVVSGGKGAAGRIEVILGNALLLARDTEVTVSLYRDGSEMVGEPVSRTLSSVQTRQEIVFDGLEKGTYRLVAQAPGFVSYTHEDITVDGEIRTLEIYTGLIALGNDAQMGYEKGKIHPGTMLLGDVNGDGQLDNWDRDAIIQAIEKQPEAAGNTDLDGDGKNTLVDLQYFVSSLARMNETKEGSFDLLSTVRTRVAPEAVEISKAPDTAIQEGSGAVSDLLKEGGSHVTLTPAEGENISAEHPVELGFDLTGDGEKADGAMMETISIEMGDHAILEGEITVVTGEGDEAGTVYRILGGKVSSHDTIALFAALGGEQEEGQDSLLIDLGGQVAVKKVTLRVTKTSGGSTLADITKVEFLNDMEKRIPELKPEYPTGLQAVEMDKAFTLTWNPSVNVTGYEVKIACNGKEEIVRTAANSLEVKSTSTSGDGKLVNGTVYEVCVQSVNGSWTSGYSDVLYVTPRVSARPDPPDNLKATGGLNCVRMSWKNMKDTDYYRVYYREKGASAFAMADQVARSSYEITGLKDRAVYEVYVTGVNELGESGDSIHSEAETVSVLPALMPKYKLINEAQGVGKLSAHIVNVTHGQGAMVNSPLDEGEAKQAFGAADKDFRSFYQMKDWDDGSHYESENKGLIFTFDQPYEMNYITFAESENLGWYSRVSVFWYDHENACWQRVENPRLLEKRDVNNTRYYAIKLDHAVKSDMIRLGFTRGSGYANVVVAEVNFYHYDPLEDDILGLYADDLHSTLRPEVDSSDIQALQTRLDTKDAASGEYHPERATLQKELDTAREILNAELTDVIYIDPTITAAKDKHVGFGGLNAWQPLGIAAAAGEKVVIYVGHNTQRTGDVSRLKLIATQHHAEASAFAKDVATLRVGRNEITIPSIQSLATEGGGSLYVEYTGNDAKDRYAVRVSGGTKIPVLNLYGVTDANVRSARILAYVEALKEQTQGLKELHEEFHEGSENRSVDRAFDEKNCILDATDIMMDQMMYSVSGTMLQKGLTGGTVQEQAEQLDQSLQAMEQMLTLFYQHKGLTEEAGAPETDRLPAQHLNIRYMRMFAGAFMYASGNHIGIEWDSVSGLSGGRPIQADEKGKYIDGSWFGWGISHEIGHDINQSAYAIAEVTNNYFALLSSAKDNNDSIRFQYPEVYKKVTSNTVGRASNVFTQLALYWQLHLAYDRDYNYKTYDSYAEQFSSLFFARVDSYARDPSRAPGSLILEGDVDQKLMRLSCAAAGKDLTDFFLRWGMLPDAGTYAYAQQFEKEERALYYLTDDARAYEIEHGTGATIRGKDVVSASSRAAVSEKVPNEVTITITGSADPEVLLGYEIVRYQYEDGKPVGQVVGFTTTDSFVDHVSTVNNRVMDYEVTAIDKFGYRSAPKKVGTVRISHDGSYDKSMWTFEKIALESEQDELPGADETDPCEPEKEPAIQMVIDNDYEATYTGTTKAEDAVILISFHQVLAASGLKYTVKGGNPITDYEVAVSLNGTDWTTVKTGTFQSGEDTQIVYFENEKKDPWICTYDAAYLRLRAIGQKTVSVTELDVLGPTGDSISFGAAQSGTDGAVGILQSEYVYEKKTGKTIPKGSLIFTGNYKGNPAYNVVVLYDEKGDILGGVQADGALAAHQIILANVPEQGALGEVSSGIWIYWIEPDESGKVPDISGLVRAQLYRVDNALTNQGQRLVSDAMPLTVPERLPSITLQQ